MFILFSNSFQFRCYLTVDNWGLHSLMLPSSCLHLSWSIAMALLLQWHRTLLMGLWFITASLSCTLMVLSFPLICHHPFSGLHFPPPEPPGSHVFLDSLRSPAQARLCVLGTAENLPSCCFLTLLSRWVPCSELPWCSLTWLSTSFQVSTILNTFQRQDHMGSKLVKLLPV